MGARVVSDTPALSKGEGGIAPFLSPLLWRGFR